MGAKRNFFSLQPSAFSLSAVAARVPRAMVAVAAVLLVLLMLLSGVSVVARLCGAPFAGEYELAGFAGALLAAFALAETQRTRGHVELDVLTRRYTPRARRVAGAVNALLGAAAMGVVVLQLARSALAKMRAGEVSETLRLPFAWLMLAVAAGFLLLALVYVADALAACRKGAAEQLQFPVDEDTPK
jgi:TRAP-type C4-dicarboxylate transport system permease small subunit